MKDEIKTESQTMEEPSTLRRRVNEGEGKEALHVSEEHFPSLSEQLEFEKLVADIAAKLALAGPEQLEKSIDWTLQSLGRFLGTERSFLGQLSEDGKRFFFTNTWAAEGFTMDSGIFKMDLEPDIPWVARQIRNGLIIHAGPGLTGLPDEAEDLRRQLEADGINSGLVVPIQVEGRSIGMLGLDTILQPWDYPQSIVDRLRIVADMIGATLLRVQAQKKLMESEGKFRAFMENLPAVAYIKDESGKHTYGNKELFNRFEMPLEKFIGTCSSDFFEQAVVEKIEHYDELVRAKGVVIETDDWSDKLHGQEHWWKEIKFPINVLSGERMVGGFAFDITERKHAEEKLRKAFEEIKGLKDHLEQENIYLREEIKLEHQHETFIGKSMPIKNVLSQAEEVAKTESTVLILGETGTGKELLAREIHKLSGRKEGPLVNVNCASLPPTLIESELFGREKGAYTGALSRQTGRFEIADGSTLFLDEIGELPLELQVKLLRVLHEGQFERLGSPKTITVDVRVIAATNRDLEKAVEEGRFREDLFYRLNVYPIEIPPLRERLEDIASLIWAFVREFGDRMGKKIDRIPRESLETLKRCHWPGNVRELKNVIERAMIISKGSTLQINAPKMNQIRTSRIESLDELQCNHIIRALKMTGGRVSGKNGAAAILKINPKTLQSRMRKLGINRK